MGIELNGDYHEVKSIVDSTAIIDSTMCDNLNEIHENIERLSESLKVKKNTTTYRQYQYLDYCVSNIYELTRKYHSFLDDFYNVAKESYEIANVEKLDSHPFSDYGSTAFVYDKYIEKTETDDKTATDVDFEKIFFTRDDAMNGINAIDPDLIYKDCFTDYPNITYDWDEATHTTLIKRFGIPIGWTSLHLVKKDDNTPTDKEEEKPVNKMTPTTDLPKDENDSQEKEKVWEEMSDQEKLEKWNSWTPEEQKHAYDDCMDEFEQSKFSRLLKVGFTNQHLTDVIGESLINPDVDPNRSQEQKNLYLDKYNNYLETNSYYIFGEKSYFNNPDYWRQLEINTAGTDWDNRVYKYFNSDGDPRDCG